MRHLLIPPEDRHLPARVRRLQELGIGGKPDPEMDEFAREAGRILDARIAGVNLIDGDQQYFAGLYSKDLEAADPADRPADPDKGRVLHKDLGYCRHVIARRRALVLEDIQDFARFAVDAVRDQTGIRSYMGTPLIDRTGVALGTVWVGDTEPQRWGRDGLEVIKAVAARLIERLERTEPVGVSGFRRVRP
ncbi:MAG: GAF domain-containing protein [Micromonosporaceae bacterium]